MSKYLLYAKSSLGTTAVVTPATAIATHQLKPNHQEEKQISVLKEGEQTVLKEFKSTAYLDGYKDKFIKRNSNIPSWIIDWAKDKTDVICSYLLIKPKHNPSDNKSYEVKIKCQYLDKNKESTYDSFSFDINNEELIEWENIFEDFLDWSMEYFEKHLRKENVKFESQIKIENKSPGTEILDNFLSSEELEDIRENLLNDLSSISKSLKKAKEDLICKSPKLTKTNKDYFVEVLCRNTKTSKL